MHVDTWKQKHHKQVSLPCSPVSCDDTNQHNTEKNWGRKSQGEGRKEMKKCCCLTASFQQTPAAGSQISLLSLPAKLQMFPPLLLKWEASPTQLIFWFSLVLTCPGDRLYPADPVLSKVQKMASGEGFSLFAFACLFTNCKENEFLVNNHLFQKWHSH